MFAYALKFNQPVNFVTKRVTTMASMFNETHAFNQPVIFDTSKVTDMNNMFSNAKVFNQTVALFQVGAVRDLSYMFNGLLARFDGLEW
jgi:hypothetical protein